MSSRTSGAHLASDGPCLQLPTMAVVLLHVPLLVTSDAAACGKKNMELPQVAPSAAAPRTGVREEEQPHQRSAAGLRRPPPTAAQGAVVLLFAPLLVPSGAAARGKRPRELPQAALSAAAPRNGVREEEQPLQRGAPGLRR